MCIFGLFYFYLFLSLLLQAQIPFLFEKTTKMQNSTCSSMQIILWSSHVDHLLCLVGDFADIRFLKLFFDYRFPSKQNVEKSNRKDSLKENRSNKNSHTLLKKPWIGTTIWEKNPSLTVSRKQA